MICCASHRFNLAMKLYLAPHEILLSKISELMKKLQTYKNRAVLRKSTTLVPVIRNSTRWSSTYEMLKRYCELRPMIDSSSIELATLLPSSTENLMTEILLRGLKKFHSITLKLQSEDVDIGQVRVLFDAVILEFPDLGQYLSPNAEIVKSAAFETAIVKTMSGVDLTLVENDLLSRFSSNEVTEAQLDRSDDYAESFLKRQKLENSCLNLKWIPPTSNICERGLSRSRLTQTHLRHASSPVHMEAIQFLHYNRELWSAETVSKLI